MAALADRGFPGRSPGREADRRVAEGGPGELPGRPVRRGDGTGRAHRREPGHRHPHGRDVRRRGRRARPRPAAAGGAAWLRPRGPRPAPRAGRGPRHRGRAGVQPDAGQPAALRRRCRRRAGVDVTPVAAAPEATGDADVVACAARSRDESPVLRGEWLNPGTTVVSIGSTLPEQREVDVSVLRRADLIVADVPGEVAHDTGDMIAAAAAGIDVTSRLVSLSDLIAGRVPGRRGAGAAGVAVYKSGGSALQDVVVAGQLLATARQRGLGTPLPDTIKPVLK